MGFAQPVDNGKNADQHQPRAHQDVAEEEDQDDELGDDGQTGEGDRVGQCAQGLEERKPGHHLSGGLAHERGDRNDGVAVGAQGVDEHR